MSGARGRSGGKFHSSSGACRHGKWSGSSDWKERKNSGDDGDKKDKEAGGKLLEGKQAPLRGDSVKWKRCGETGRKTVRCPDPFDAKLWRDAKLASLVGRGIQR